jgi:Putative adhesin
MYAEVFVGHLRDYVDPMNSTVFPQHVRTRSSISLAVLAIASLGLGVGPSADAKPAKKALQSIRIVNGQGSVTISPCPAKSKKGICAKGVKVAGGVASFGSVQGDVSVAVPSGVSISVTTVQGDVTIGSIDNPITVITEQGSITATALRSPTVLANTTQGDVELAFAKDPSTVNSMTESGDITITSAAVGAESSFRLKTVQGDINVTPKAQVATFEGRTTQGSISATLPGGPYKVTASTVQGKVNNTLATAADSPRNVIAVIEAQGDVTLN